MASPEGQAGAADVPKYYHEDPLFMFFENFGTNREAASVALTPQTTTKGLPMPLKVNALDHIVVNVADVARTVDWYQKVLGMEVSEGFRSRSRQAGPDVAGFRPPEDQRAAAWCRQGRVVHRRPRDAGQR
jgi:hypothetical protein